MTPWLKIAARLICVAGYRAGLIDPYQKDTLNATIRTKGQL